MKTLNPRPALKWYLAQWRELEMILIENTELCKELGVHQGTTARWRREKRLPHIQITRKIYYRMSDLLPFLSRLEEIKGMKTEAGSPNSEVES